jgi:HlyD family secretion protein
MGLFTVLSGRLPSAESNLERYLHVSGRIVGEAISLHSQSCGVVEHLMVREGERVAAGSLLLRVGEEENSARVEEVETLIEELEQEKLRRLEELRELQPFGHVSLEMAEAGALFAAIDLSLAESSSGDRARRDRSMRVVTDSDLSAARKRYETAKETLSAVREIAGRIEEVSSELFFMESQLEKLVQERHSLLFRFRQGELTAPVDAYVVSVHVHPGLEVSRGQGMIELVSANKVAVEGLVQGHRAGMITEGQEALIYPHPLGESPIRGLVADIGHGPETVLSKGNGGRLERHTAHRIRLELTGAHEHVLPDQPAEAIIRLLPGEQRSEPTLLFARLISRSQPLEQETAIRTD